MLTGNLVLVGQLLGTAFACGLNLYATIAVVGLSARFDLVALPPGMRGLENGVIIGLAAAIYLVEFVSDRVPGIDHAWEAVHTVIRPAAAAMLTLLALEAAPDAVQYGAMVAAALVALVAHGTKAGLRLITTPRWLDDEGHLAPRRPLARTAVSLLEDAVAVGIAVAALLYPQIGAVMLGAVGVLLLLGGPRLWRAAGMGARALVARARGFFGTRDWTRREALPAAIRNRIPQEPLGRSPARAVPAAVRGLRGAGAYRGGWLVFTCDGPRFIYSARFRTRCCDLADVADVQVRRGVLTDTLELSNGPSAQGMTLFLFKDGPPAAVTAAELRSQHRSNT